MPIFKESKITVGDLPHYYVFANKDGTQYFMKLPEIEGRKLNTCRCVELATGYRIHLFKDDIAYKAPIKIVFSPEVLPGQPISNKDFTK